MKNVNLLQDLQWLSADEDTRVGDITQETIRYINYLESKEDRLRLIEDKMNEIQEKKLPGNELLLDHFREFKND